MENNRLRPLGVWIAMTLMAGVVAGYYIYHKPLTPSLALALSRHLWNILICCAIVSIAGGLGKRLLKINKIEGLTRLSLEAAFGLGLLGLSLLMLGYLRLYIFVFILPATIVGVVYLRRDILSWWQQWESVRGVIASSSRFGRLMGSLTSVIFFTGFIVALAPPLAYDALVYHLVLPKHYILAKQMVYVPELMFWGMPQLAEMNYTWAMVLGGNSAATLLGWVVALLATVGLLGLITNHLGANAGWVSIAALLAGSTVALSISWGYVDWWTVLFGVAFLSAIAMWQKAGENRWIILAGVFAGMALGVKYSAGVLLVCGFFLVITKPEPTPTEKTRSLIWLVLPALLVFSPWLLKNWAATSNPIYPLFIPSGEMSAFRIKIYQGGLPWGGWLDAVLLPLRATIWGVEEGPGYSASIGPLLLALSFAALIFIPVNRPNRQPLVRAATIISLVGLVLWAALGRFSSYLLQSRLYLSLFPAFAVLAAAGYQAISKITANSVRFGLITRVLVIIVFGLNTFEIIDHTLSTDAARQLLGIISKDRYLEENLGWYARAVKALAEMPPGSQTLMLWEPRSLGCLPLCQPDDVLDRWLRARYETDSRVPADADEILAKWRAKGFTHLMFYQAGARFIQNESSQYLPEDWIVLQHLLDNQEKVKSFGDAYILYRLMP